MQKGYSIEHVGENALGNEFTMASIQNFHSLNEVVIMYWHSDNDVIKNSISLVALIRAKKATQPLDYRLKIRGLNK